MKKIALVFVFAITLFVANNSVAQSNKKIEFINLKGETLFPEGILALPTGELLVGGFGDGSIQKIDQQKQVSYFSKAGENGMSIAVGMAVDQKNKQLWVANFNFKTESGKPGSNLKLFDLETGKLLKTIPKKYIEGVFFNEIAIDKSGNVYVTNTFGPQIYTASAQAEQATVLVEHPLLSNPAPDQPFDLNGLAITPDGQYLIASVMDRLDAGDGKLVRIHLATKQVSAIRLEGEEAVKAFAGSDGMFFDRGTLYMVNVYAKAGAIITASFSQDFSVAKLKLHLKVNDVYDRPTASAILNGRLYTVNSQLNRIIDDADGQLNTPPVLPFRVVSVPLSEF
jgi:sugar lactone lactonase YvrE